MFHQPQGRNSGVLRGFLGQKGRNEMKVFLEVNLGTAESPCLQMGSAGNKHTGVQMPHLQVRESNRVGRNDMNVLHSFIIYSFHKCVLKARHRTNCCELWWYRHLLICQSQQPECHPRYFCLSYLFPQAICLPNFIDLTS